MDIVNLNRILDELVDNSIPLSSILRKVYILAIQLKDSNLIEFIENELNGYDQESWKARDDFPEYRRPMGYLKGEGPYGVEKPLLINNEEVMDKICRPRITWSIGKIESIFMNNSKDNEILVLSLNSKNEALIRNALSFPVKPFLEYQRAEFLAIIEAVRNKLLSLLLERKDKYIGIEFDRGNLVDIIGAKLREKQVDQKKIDELIGLLKEESK